MSSIMKVVEDMLRIILELESPKKELFKVRYDFSKLRVSCKNLCITCCIIIRFRFVSPNLFIQSYLGLPELILS